MAQRALTPGNVARCTECGVATLPDAPACERCGQPFEGSIQAVLCPICNSINPAGASKCVNCEARFPAPGAIRPPVASRKGPPEENLRRVLRLSRQKARTRTASEVRDPVLGTEALRGSVGDRKRLKVQRVSDRPTSGTKGDAARRTPSHPDLATLRQRMGHFEDQMERWIGERDRLQDQVNDLVRMKDELEAVMRDLNARVGDGAQDDRAGPRPSRSRRGPDKSSSSEPSSERPGTAKPSKKARKG